MEMAGKKVFETSTAGQPVWRARSW